MPRRKFQSKNSNEDAFETDAFSFLNRKDSSEQANQDEPSAQEDGSSADSDDDDAPDDIGFHESKQSVMDQIKSALQQVDSERKKKKEMRKKIDEQYKEQKAKKLEQLAKSKLSEDILEGIDDSLPPKKKSKLDKSKKKKKIRKSEDDNSYRRKLLRVLKVKSPYGKYILVDTVDFDQGHEKEDTHFSEEEQEDFIAFTDRESGVKVAHVKAVEKQTKSLAQSAAEFKQNRLHAKHIQRQSNKDRLAAMEKRRQRFR